jgi:hypothetical protein
MVTEKDFQNVTEKGFENGEMKEKGSATQKSGCRSGQAVAGKSRRSSIW